MKYESKSATNRTKRILFLLLFLLTACADVKAPTWLTGEPGDDVLLAPRVVSGPKEDAEKTWPNLAEVPDTKPNFTKQSARNKQTLELQSENLKAQAEMERIRNIQIDDTRMRETTMTDEDAFSFSALKP